MAARVLVVEDEPHVARLMARRLVREGYDVEVTGNGREALERLIADEPFDIVVTDYNMPHMDGRELCEQIRERFAGREMHIFLVTARLDHDLRSWAEGLPSVQYVEKPVSMQDLVRRLANVPCDRKTEPGEPADG